MQTLSTRTWLLAILIWPGIMSAQAIWTPLQQPYGGTPYPFLETEQQIISGSQINGIVVSSDDGLSWQWNDWSITRIVPLAVNDNGEVFGFWLYERILARSTNNGASWESLGTRWDANVQHLVATPSGDLFALILSSVMHSSDGGATWTSVSPVSNRTIGWIAAAPDGTIFATQDGGENLVWRSTDYGASWNIVSREVLFISFAFGKEGEIFVSTNKGILRSNDNGSSFESIAGRQYRGLHRQTLQYDDAGVIWFVASDGGFYRMSPDGLHVDSIPIPAGECRLVHLTKEGSLLLGYVGVGIWRSDDDGSTWKQTGLDRAADIGRLVEHDTGKYLASITYGGLFGSADGGKTWERTGLFDREVTLLLTDCAGTVFAHSLRDTLYRSTNGGISWEESYVSSEEFLDGYLSPNGSVLLASAKGIHHSADNGDSWAMAVEGIAFSDFGIAPNGDVWAASTGSLYRSTDDGRAWNEIGFGELHPDRVSMTVTSYGTLLAAVIHDHDDYLLRSADGGLTWQRTELPCPMASYPSLSIGFGGIPYMTTNCGLYRSMDDGLTWEQYAKLPKGQLINALLFAKEGDLFAATSEGIFMTSDDLSVSMQVKDSAIEDFQVSVGPEYGLLRVSFTVAKSIDVRLVLSDMQGKEVARGERLRMEAGDHYLDWKIDGSIPTGTYLLQLITDEGNLSRKFVFIR